MNTAPQAGGPRRRVAFIPHWHDNPYQELLASALAHLGLDVTFVSRRLLFLRALWRDGRPDVVHIHAPDHFVVYRRTLPAAIIALGLYVGQLVLLRLLGVRVVWTVHDLTNHERRRPRIDTWCRWITAQLAGALIVHCEAARQEVAASVGVAPHHIHVVQHGHYLDWYPEHRGDARSARQALDLPEDPQIFLFFGNLRRYKGLEQLTDAWARLARPHTLLVMAGEPFDADVASTLVARVSGRDDVILRTGTVPDAQVATYLRAADVVVFPFTSSLTSGSMALALSFGKPVVASRLGCAGEMMTDAGGFLYDAGDPVGLVSALRAAADARDRLEAIGRSNRARMTQHDWTTIARRTVAIYDGTTG